MEVIVIIICCLLALLTLVFGKDSNVKGGNEPTIVLLPGLGEGAESYNWNLSTSHKLQEEKYKTSLQDKISALGYKTICPIIEPTTLDNFISEIAKHKPNMIIGHSIGARIAQYYGEQKHIPYIMLDPTPDYVLEDIKVEPSKVASYMQMIKDAKNEITSSKWNPKILIYSIDDTDKNKVKKEQYFEQLDCKKVKLINATHWVHVSHPEIVLEYLQK